MRRQLKSCFFKGPHYSETKYFVMCNLINAMPLYTITILTIFRDSLERDQGNAQKVFQLKNIFCHSSLNLYIMICEKRQEKLNAATNSFLPPTYGRRHFQENPPSSKIFCIFEKRVGIKKTFKRKCLPIFKDCNFILNCLY